MGQEEEEKFLVEKVNGGKNIQQVPEVYQTLSWAAERQEAMAASTEPRSNRLARDTLQGLILNKCHWPPDNSSAFGLLQQPSKTLK